MTDPLYHRDKARIQQNFNNAAGSYDQVAVLQRTVGMRLLERLDVMKLKPKRILDLGSGTGLMSLQLARRYKPAHLIQLDMAFNMLKESRQKKPGQKDRKRFNRQHFLCADAEKLPIGDGCMEFVFSNLMFQWVSRLDLALSETCRVLQPGGLLLFSTLGPASLTELRESWARVDEHVHVNAFLDMHDIGDALVRAGFAGPVMETETFTLLYDDGWKLMKELQRLGAGNVNAGRRKSLTGKQKLRGMLREYEDRYGQDRLPATFEAIYGHAWTPETSAASLKTKVFPITLLGRNRDKT